MASLSTVFLTLLLLGIWMKQDTCNGIEESGGGSLKRPECNRDATCRVQVPLIPLEGMIDTIIEAVSVSCHQAASPCPYTYLTTICETTPEKQHPLF